MSPGGIGLPSAVPHRLWHVGGLRAGAVPRRDRARAASYEVVLADPRDGAPDVRAAVGFVGGMSTDTANLALAAQGAHDCPDAFICLRQAATTAAPLLYAASPRTLSLSDGSCCAEAFARIDTAHMDVPGVCRAAGRRLGCRPCWAGSWTVRVGLAGPVILVIDAQSAPAVIRWIEHGEP